jgi:GntR family transcriptional regulator
MQLRLNPTSGISLYQQLIEQIKLSIQTGAVRAGEQLPSVRKMAEDLVINPNTVARAYRDLEAEGVIELRHGSGAYVLDSIAVRSGTMQKAKAIVHTAVTKLTAFELGEDEIRRLVESELANRRADQQGGKRSA